MSESNETVPETVLVVDDAPENVGVLLDTLGREGYQVLVATDGASALEQAGYARPQLILLDVLMPGLDGYETCRRLKADPAIGDIPVIFMTLLDELPDKLRGFQAGAVDYVTKPFQHEEVLARVRAHLGLRRLQAELAAINTELEQRVAARTAELEKLKNRLQAENVYLREEISEHGNFNDIVGESAALREVLRKIEMVAPTPTTVLIHGETGTGKELVARAIHERSPRSERPLVKLNCSAISAGLVESELFGHVKGAFTGAVDKRIGRFELADGGTLFLDEVSELPLETQSKLLRVLQEREFEPVGSSRTRRVDVRIIAATNRDLGKDVEAGRFRADLYFRLNVFPIEVPPLRERRQDIPLLVEFFLSRIVRRIGKNFTGTAPAALQRLCAHDWPGNIRDLQNTIERAVILSRGPLLEVPWALAGGQSGNGSGGTAPSALPDSLEAVERAHIVATLKRTRGVIEGPKGAARLLGLKPSTARFRIRRLGIDKQEWQ